MYIMRTAHGLGTPVCGFICFPISGWSSLLASRLGKFSKLALSWETSCEKNVRILMSMLLGTRSGPTLVDLPSKLDIYTVMSESTNYRTESVFCHFRPSLRAPDLARLLNIYPRFPPSLNSKFGDEPRNCRKSLWSAAVKKFLSMLCNAKLALLMASTDRRAGWTNNLRYICSMFRFDWSTTVDRAVKSSA